MSEDEELKEIHVRVPASEKERMKEKTDNISQTCREIFISWNDVVEDYGIDEELTNVDLAALRSYRNAIEKHITMLESKRDKMNRRIEEIEEERKDSDVLVELEIDVDGTK